MHTATFVPHSISCQYSKVHNSTSKNSFETFIQNQENVATFKRIDILILKQMTTFSSSN